MHYNLLNYGNNYNDCNSSNNNVNDKNEYLKILVDYLQPDVLTVNEIDDYLPVHDNLLNNVFNIDGSELFSRANPPNNSYSPIMNQVYYNNSKLSLISNSAIETNYRDIDIFNFLVKNDNSNDSVLIHSIVAHLKAGNYEEAEQERAYETNKLMNYLQNNGLKGNYLLSGDLNVYGDSETAFQNLIAHPNEDIRFYDPVDRVGPWHESPDYTDVHTQSTHLSGGCPAGGGMDDRFDFILPAGDILDGTGKVKYSPGSYTTVGQDGQRLNMSLTSTPNNSAPSQVLDALYNMSDHLPIVLDLVVNLQPGRLAEKKNQIKLQFTNPARQIIRLSLAPESVHEVKISLLDYCGQLLIKKTVIFPNTSNIEIPVTQYPPGVYLLQVSGDGMAPATAKVVIIP